jgi:CSLREA domain-containing protein
MKGLTSLVLAATAASLLLATTASAAGGTITVTSKLDDNSNCTLREAITAANSDSVGGSGCVATGTLGSPDTIVFDPTAFPPGGAVETINLIGAEPLIFSDVNIQGYGMNQLTVDGDAGIGRVFTISAGTVEISGLKATGGQPANGTPYGGGIWDFSSGALTLDDVCVCGNLVASSSAVVGTNVTANGAGIQATASGPVTIENSVIDNNDMTATQSAATGTDYASGSGAGANLGSSAVTITNSTISNNDITSTKTGSTGDAFASGGGIQVYGPMTVERSTFSGNHVTATATGSSVSSGGAIVLGGTAPSSTLQLSTLADNRVAATQVNGGGLIQSSSNNPLSIVSSTIARNGTAASTPATDGKNLSVEFGTNNTIVNSIVSNPAGGGGNCLVSGGTLTPLGYSADYTPAAAPHIGTCGFGAGTNSTADPLLDPTGLAANGGATKTIALQTGSPMIDKGSNAGQSTLGIDQRGLTRPSEFFSIADAANGTDIGAFEVQSLETPPVTPPPPAATGPTGQRAAALKKCKKKKSKAARKKCKKKAIKLPA